MFSDSDNPYRPPCGQSVSVADWTLFKRVFYTLAVWAIVYLAVAAFLTWHSFDAGQINQTSPLHTQLRDFMLDWRDI